MASLNIAIISGNLGRDPELKYLPSGTALCEFTVAVSDYYKPKDGDAREQTYWIRCKAWGRTGEIIAEHFSKGSRITVTGKLTQEEWEDKEGKKQSKTLINVDTFIFMDAKKPNGEASRTPVQGKPARDPYLDASDDDQVPF